jgi:hypothetical protein
MARIKRGWTLAKESWTVLQKDRSLAIFPLISIIATYLALVLLMLPGVLISEAVNQDWTILPFLLLAAYGATFTAVSCNVALAGAAMLSLDGKDTTLQDGLSVARARRGVIARWAGVQVAVGVVLGVLENASGDSGRGLGSLAGSLMGTAWSIATFFVVPLLALEGLGPKEALSRSVALTRERWGEGLSGSAGITLAVFLAAVLPVLMLFGGASEVSASVPALGVVLYVLGFMLLVGAIVLGSALNIIFRVALYRWATTGQTAPGFETDALTGAFTRR